VHVSDNVQPATLLEFLVYKRAFRLKMGVNSSVAGLFYLQGSVFSSEGKLEKSCVDLRHEDVLVSFDKIYVGLF